MLEVNCRKGVAEVAALEGSGRRRKSALEHSRTQSLSDSRKYKDGAKARTGIKVVHEHEGVHPKEHKVGEAAPTDMKSSMKTAPLHPEVTQSRRGDACGHEGVHEHEGVHCTESRRDGAHGHKSRP